MKSKIWMLACLIIGIGIISTLVLSNVTIEQKQPEKLLISEPWWKQVAPDLTVDGFEYYASKCSIVQVNPEQGAASAKTIFKVPYSVFSSCRNDPTPLIHDGAFFVFSVCEIAFSAGGCGGGRYRSDDTIHWQEDIGITWINGEQYEAWRNLGSTSSKADSVKRFYNLIARLNLCFINCSTNFIG